MKKPYQIEAQRAVKQLEGMAVLRARHYNASASRATGLVCIRKCVTCAQAKRAVSLHSR